MTVLALLLCAGSHSAWALSLGPAMFMVQHVVPGQTLDVRKKAGVVFTVKNDTDTDGSYSLTCRKPSQNLGDWEAGYEEIPNPEWCVLEKTEFVVPAKTKVEIGLTINIPDKLDHYNCKWMLAVVLTAGKNTGIAVGLAIAARVQIETAFSDDKQSGGASAIAAVPCVVQVKGKAGSVFAESVTLRNNAQRELECKSERLVDVYPKEDIKYPRYASPRFQALVKETWLANVEPKFTMKNGENHELKLNGQIPATAKPGGKWEELVFVSEVSADPVLAPGKAGLVKRQVKTFFRVQYTVSEEK